MDILHRVQRAKNYRVLSSLPGITAPISGGTATIVAWHLVGFCCSSLFTAFSTIVHVTSVLLTIFIAHFPPSIVADAHIDDDSGYYDYLNMLCPDGNTVTFDLGDDATSDSTEIQSKLDYYCRLNCDDSSYVY
jgi:hypothetical protein